MVSRSVASLILCEIRSETPVSVSNANLHSDTYVSVAGRPDTTTGSSWFGKPTLNVACSSSIESKSDLVEIRERQKALAMRSFFCQGICISSDLLRSSARPISSLSCSWRTSASSWTATRFPSIFKSSATIPDSKVCYRLEINTGVSVVLIGISGSGGRQAMHVTFRSESGPK